MGNPSLSTAAIERPPERLLPTALEHRAARLARGHVVIVCGVARVVIVCGGRDYADWERVG